MVQSYDRFARIFPTEINSLPNCYTGAEISQASTDESHQLTSAPAVHFMNGKWKSPPSLPSHFIQRRYPYPALTPTPITPRNHPSVFHAPHSAIHPHGRNIKTSLRHHTPIFRTCVRCFCLTTNVAQHHTGAITPAPFPYPVHPSDTRTISTHPKQALSWGFYKLHPGG